MRRTEEDKKRITELKERVLALAKEYNVTYYEIGMNTKIAITTARKIWDGVTEYPNFKNLKAIEDYIINKYIEDVREDPMPYEKEPLERKIDNLTQLVHSLSEEIKSYSLKNEIMFEIIRNAKNEEVKVINAESERILAHSKDTVQK